jgi:hypothetical protein
MLFGLAAGEDFGAESRQYFRDLPIPQRVVVKEDSSAVS